MWLAYHKAFREHAAVTGLFDWCSMNAQLFNFHAAGALLRSSSPSSGEFSEPSGSSDRMHFVEQGPLHRPFHALLLLPPLQQVWQIALRSLMLFATGAESGQ